MIVSSSYDVLFGGAASLSIRIGPLLQYNISLPRLRLEAYSLRAQDSCLNWCKRLPLKGDEITEISHSWTRARTRADEERWVRVADDQRRRRQRQSDCPRGRRRRRRRREYTDWWHLWLKLTHKLTLLWGMSNFTGTFIFNEFLFLYLYILTYKIKNIFYQIVLASFFILFLIT